MNTENTDDAGEGYVFYDANCRFCVGWARRIERLLTGAGYRLVPLQSDRCRELLNLSEEQLMREMKVRTVDGEVLGGAVAVTHLLERIAGRFPAAVLRLPGVRRLADHTYKWVAAHRYCFAGKCEVPVDESRQLVELDQPRSGVRWFHWVPLLVLLAGALAMTSSVAGWVLMWLLSFALFFGFKWLALRRGVAGCNPGVPVRRQLAFLFGWVGMDARSFLAGAVVSRPRKVEWLLPILNLLGGTALTWIGARVAFGIDSHLAGWIGMIGLVLILHFGLFAMLALAWRARGVNALPLMRRPLQARTLGELWGFRWNTGFHQLANDFLFAPLKRRVGVRGATLAVFAASGVIHDLVISLPARGGYGLPTLYFVLQGTAVLLEHTDFARRWSRGVPGRMFTILVAVGPAFWLFHPSFVQHVMLPFLRILHAI